MSFRKIIKIDEEKCNGCGLCVPACHEGALRVIDGKARLVSDVYCDGLGDCLGKCPQDAISIIEREADDYDLEAVEHHTEKGIVKTQQEAEPLPCGCPGTMSRKLQPQSRNASDIPFENLPSRLENWPVQIMLAPVNADYFQGAMLTISADCVPFAYADFHRRFLDGRVLLVGCPKLDDYDLYLKKLTQIFKQNDIKEIEVVHMEVPCCFGLVNLVRKAAADSGKNISIKMTMIGLDGAISGKTIPEFFLEEIDT